MLLKWINRFFGGPNSQARSKALQLSCRRGLGRSVVVDYIYLDWPSCLSKRVARSILVCCSQLGENAEFWWW